MAKVYLALYKGRKTIKTPKDLAFRIIEWVIRKVTGGQYSHCEIAVPVAFSDGLFPFRVTACRLNKALPEG